MNVIVENINSAGNTFVEFALPMLVQSSVLIVILLLADLLLRKKVKAVFRYWIWMLVLVKLVLPTSLSSPLSLGYLFGDKLTYQDLADTTSKLETAESAPAEISPIVDTLHIQPNPYISPPVPATSFVEPSIEEQLRPPVVPVTPLSWQGIVFLVWLAVVITMGLLLLQRALFVRGLVAQAKEAGRLMKDELAYCCASMRIKYRVGLKVSPNATTPSVCGLIRPVILVPWNLVSTLGASRLRTVLMHELAHIKRCDLWVNLAQTALQIIYFYNPLLWLANCVVRRIREQAVDEAVLVAMGERAQRYPQTLVDVAKMAFKRPALSLRLIGVVESESALAGRIKHILGRPMPKTTKLGVVGVLAVIITAAVLLPMARAQRQPEPETSVEAGPLDHFVGKYAMAGHPDTAAFEITKKGDVFIFNGLDVPKFEMDIFLKGLEGRKFEMKKGRDSLRFGNNPRERYRVRYNAAEDRYILDRLGMRGEVQDGVSFPLTDLVKISAKKPEDIFSATLPNGVTVELMGICELPGQDKQWWAADGSLLEDIFWEGSAANRESSADARQVVFRIRSDESAPAPTVSFQPKRRLQPPGSWSGAFFVEKDNQTLEELRGCSFSLHDDQKSIDISANIGYGPWKTLTKLAMNSEISLPKPVFTDIGYITWNEPTEEDGKTNVSATMFDAVKVWRIVAVDKQGDIHVSSTALGHGFDGHQIAKSTFSLPLNRIEKFRFQTRPFGEITFKNVSLEPNFKTNVQVKVEKAESVLTDEIVTAKVGPDVGPGIESNVSLKLVMLLDAINSCAAETDLNIDSISITDRNISIKGDTSGRTNTRKFLDAIEKNELKISQMSLLDAKGNRDKFSIIVDPKQDWQQWWQQRKTDVQLGAEETVSPKLIILLVAIKSVAAEMDLNIESISVTARSMSIEGDTSGRTDTLKFLDAIKDNGLEVSRLDLDTRNNRDRFRIAVDLRKDWRQWWQKHKADIEAEIPAKEEIAAEEEVASKLSQLKRLLEKPPIVAYDVKLNFAEPTVRDGTFHSEQSIAFSLSFHNIEIAPAEKFTLGHLLIGQTTWPVHLEDNGIIIKEGVAGQKISSLKWPAAESKFEKVIKVPIKYGQKEYSCPVRVELDRYNKDAPIGSYWFCAYLSGRLPWGAGGRGFEIVNLDQQMEFRLTGDGSDPRDAVLGIDINGDGRIDPAKEGGEKFDLYEPFIIGSKVYQLAEVDPYLPRVVFRELDARLLPDPLAKADVPVEVEYNNELYQKQDSIKNALEFIGTPEELIDTSFIRKQGHLPNPRQLKFANKLFSVRKSKDVDMFISLLSDGSKEQLNDGNNRRMLHRRIKNIKNGTFLSGEYDCKFFATFREFTDEDWDKLKKHVSFPEPPTHAIVYWHFHKPNYMITGSAYYLIEDKGSYKFVAQTLLSDAVIPAKKEQPLGPKKYGIVAFKQNDDAYTQPGHWKYQWDIKLTDEVSENNVFQVLKTTKVISGQADLHPEIAAQKIIDESRIEKYKYKKLKCRFYVAASEPSYNYRKYGQKLSGWLCGLSIASTSKSTSMLFPGKDVTNVKPNKQGNFVGSDLELLSFETSDGHIKYQHKVILRKDDSPEAKSAALLRLEQMTRRQISKSKLQYLGGILTSYANDHNSKYPDMLIQIKPYDTDEWLDWLLENIEYLGKGKTFTETSKTVIAYDKTLLEKAGSTNVLFNEGPVQYCDPDWLKKLGITGYQKPDVPVVIGDAASGTVFEELSVKFGGIWMHWQDLQFTVRGDGSVEFSMNKGPNDKTKYKTAFKLSGEHLAELSGLLQKTNWLTAPGANVQPGYTDATRIDISLTREDKVQNVWCHDRNAEPYLSLVNFLKRIYRQEYLLNRMVAVGDKERAWAFYEISQQLQVKKGEPIAASPNHALDLNRFVPVSIDVIGRPDDHHYETIATALKLLAMLKTEDVRQQITDLTTAEQKARGEIASRYRTETIREAAVQALTVLGGEQARRHIRDMAKNHRSWKRQVNEALVEALLELDSDNCVQLLRDMASTTREAGWGLIRLGSPAIPTIIQMLESRDHRDMGQIYLIRQYIDHWEEVPKPLDARVVEAVLENLDFRLGYTTTWTNYHKELLSLAGASELPSKDARQIAEEFLTAVKTDDQMKIGAISIARGGSWPQRLTRLKELPHLQQLEITEVYTDDNMAWAVAAATGPDNENITQARIILNFLSGSVWRVFNIAFETPEIIERMRKRYLENHPNARPVPARVSGGSGVETAVKGEVKGAGAASGESEVAASEAGPRITFESLVCDLGQIPPRTKHVCEFKFTNTGNEVLKITRVRAGCACTTSLPQRKKEYAPGESGTLKVTYQSAARAGRVTKSVFVYNNTSVNPVKLTIKAEIVVKVAHQPERLNLVLDKENADCPAITLTSLDNQPFSITGFKSTGDSITADFDSSVKRTSFVIRPRVDMEKLRKGMRGQINVSLNHPECKKITVSFETLSEFKTDPRVVYVREAEPQKPVTRKVRILSNYNEDFEVESTSSKNGTIKVLAQEKVRDGYQFELEITPPEKESKRRVFTDVFSVRLKGSQVLNITCYGIYSKKPEVTVGKSAPKADVPVEAEKSNESSESKVTELTVQEPVKQRGRISGIVLSSITGKPIAGAYVGVGDFGDSGGSNYARHREQGLHSKTETDENGRFELDGLVYTEGHSWLKYHPLVVTHPDFVRHDEKIELLSSGPVPDVKVSLRPAAKIDVTIEDADGNPLEGHWLIRLEALDGRRFIPAGQDRHLSAFASGVWLEWPSHKRLLSPEFSFTELDTGEYSIDVIQLFPSAKVTVPEGWDALPLESSVTYHGGVAKLRIEAGQTKQVNIRPAHHQTNLTIKLPQVPEGPIRREGVPQLLLISRKLGLMLWDTNKAYGIEDSRLGRLHKNALLFTSVPDGDVFTIQNLPPAGYCVFAGPVMCMSAARVKVVPGRQTNVEIPKVDFDGTLATVGVWTLDRKVQFQARRYSVKELCELLTAITESNPRIVADSSIENEKLEFTESKLPVWDVLEKLYLDNGWRVDEGQGKTLIIHTVDKTDVPVEVERTDERVSRFIGADLPDSVQNVKFHSGSFAESSRALIRFDIPLSDLKNLLVKSDKIPDFSDLKKNSKIRKDMVEVHKALNIEWWKPDELESPNCATWIKSEGSKGAQSGDIIILNICCSQVENNLMRVYISLYSHAH